MTSRARWIASALSALAALGGLVVCGAFRSGANDSRMAVRALPSARVAASAGATRSTIPESGAPSLVPPSRVPPPSEAELMLELRNLKEEDPEAAVLLAREGNRRFADSADAPERASILIYALTALGNPGEARGEAEYMVNHYPESPWVHDIERFTGAHRHRNFRLNAQGELESY